MINIIPATFVGRTIKIVMKRKIAFLALLLPLLVLFSSCSKDKETYFGIDSSTTISLGANDTQAQIKIDASSDVTWTVTNAPQWCTPDVITGSGSRTVNLSVQRNTTSQPRKAQLLVVSFLGQVTVVVNQAAQ